VAIRAEGQDLDGDRLNYQWAAPAGTSGDTRAASTTWRAETVPGQVVIVVTAADGRGGQATDRVTIDVIAAPTPALGEILFDFDQTVIKPAGLAVLDEAFRQLTANPTRSLRVEGHASGEGTTDYNQALSERRTQAVRDNLAARGIAPGRIVGSSFGETRPRNDNTTEEGRRMNRRVELVLQ
jgi:outer membrane protein OmpA-like peptidoglycan-associated protein